MAASTPADRVLIGRVIKPHGIRGEVVVDPLSDLPERFVADAVVWLNGVRTAIESSRPHQGRVLIKFASVADRNAAELIRRAELTAEPLDDGRLDELDTYLISELVGMRVRLEDGTDLGEVTSSIELPESAGYDLLEILSPDGTSWQLPAVDDFVEIEEGEDGTEYLVVINPPDGLLPGTEDEAEEVRSPGETS